VAPQPTTSDSRGRPASVVIVGLGNIGSHLPSQVARTGQVGRLTLVDPDVYEAPNQRCQDVAASDLGKSKVEVQTRRVRRVDPRIEVLALRACIEDVPLGLLRADLILAGLDSRVARMNLNSTAWHLGVPWIDAAVDGGSMLARVNVYLPREGAPCLECAWDAGDYAALEQIFPCPSAAQTPSTNAPASIGAVAAAMMVVEAEKLLAGDDDHLLAGRQVMCDLRHHAYLITAYRFNPNCRFDHELWMIETPANKSPKMTLGQLVESESAGCSMLRVPGHRFSRAVYCLSCGRSQAAPLRLVRRIPSVRLHCPDCGGTMAVRGFDMRETFDFPSASRADRRRTLSSIGFCPGDVLSIEGPGTRHFVQLTADRNERGQVS